MAGVTETVTFAELGAFLQGASGRVAVVSYRPAIQACKLAVVASTQENFAGSHAPDGTPWQPLAHPRPNSKGADKPLRDTGILAASVSARGQGHYEKVSDTALEFGTNLDYAAIHQTGGVIRPQGKALAIPLTREAQRTGWPRDWQPGVLHPQGRFLAETKTGARGKPKVIRHYLFAKSVTIPARPFLGWNDQLVDDCGRILVDFVAQKIAAWSIKPFGSGGGRMAA